MESPNQSITPGSPAEEALFKIPFPESITALIAFFVSIPAEVYCVDELNDGNGHHCAWGLLDRIPLTVGASLTTRLERMGLSLFDLVNANNGDHEFSPDRFPVRREIEKADSERKTNRPAIKERVLGYLRSRLPKPQQLSTVISAEGIAKGTLEGNTLRVIHPDDYPSTGALGADNQTYSAADGGL